MLELYNETSAIPLRLVDIPHEQAATNSRILSFQKHQKAPILTHPLAYLSYRPLVCDTSETHLA
jgi:hypothetical protein